MKCLALSPFLLLITGCDVARGTVRLKAIDARSGQPLAGLRAEQWEQRLSPVWFLFPEPPYSLAATRWTNREGMVSISGNEYSHLRLCPPNRPAVWVTGEGDNHWMSRDDDVFVPFSDIPPASCDLMAWK